MDTGDIHDRLTAIAAEAWLISAMTVLLTQSRPPTLNLPQFRP